MYPDMSEDTLSRYIYDLNMRRFPKSWGRCESLSATCENFLTVFYNPPISGRSWKQRKKRAISCSIHWPVFLKVKSPTQLIHHETFLVFCWTRPSSSIRRYRKRYLTLRVNTLLIPHFIGGFVLRSGHTSISRNLFLQIVNKHKAKIIIPAIMDVVNILAPLWG